MKYEAKEMKEEDEAVRIGRFFLYILTAIVVLLALTGCTTTGRTTVNEDSLICIGFCMETDFETNTEIVKE